MPTNCNALLWVGVGWVEDAQDGVCTLLWLCFEWRHVAGILSSLLHQGSLGASASSRYNVARACAAAVQEGRVRSHRDVD